MKHPSDLHAKFLTILPRIELHARIYFRHVRCRHHKDDCIAEMIALAWKWFVRLHERGKDPNEFLMTFASLLARAINDGRRLVGMRGAKDVMNPTTQRRHGFTVEPLPNSTRASHERLSSPTGQ